MPVVLARSYTGRASLQSGARAFAPAPCISSQRCFADQRLRRRRDAGEARGDIDVVPERLNVMISASRADHRTDENRAGVHADSDRPLGAVRRGGVPVGNQIRLVREAESRKASVS